MEGSSSVTDHPKDHVDGLAGKKNFGDRGIITVQPLKRSEMQVRLGLLQMVVNSKLTSL